MALSDPKSPAPRTLTTTGGVQVIVRPPPPPRPEAPAREPEPVAEGPRAIILPEGQTADERNAFLDALCREHQGLVDDLLARRHDVLTASRPDLRQRVLLILCDHVVKTRCAPEHPRAWLGDVIRKEVRNHKDLWRPPIQEGADAEAVAQSSAKGPERTADLAGRRELLEECLADLPGDEAAVVRCVEIFEMTFEEAASAMGMPLSTVHDLARRVEKKLGRLMRRKNQGR